MGNNVSSIGSVTFVRQDGDPFADKAFVLFGLSIFNDSWAFKTNNRGSLFSDAIKSLEKVDVWRVDGGVFHFNEEMIFVEFGQW